MPSKTYGDSAGLSVYFLFLFLFYMVMVLLAPEKQAPLNPSPQHAKSFLHDHGYCLLRNVFSLESLQTLQTWCHDGNYQDIQTFLLNNTPLMDALRTVTTTDHVFQDYIWIIQKSAVHTCHRDNNGDFFNKGQQWPSYTVLVYLENMDKCLAVLPDSHLDPDSYWINATQQMENILCQAGDVVIFNANLIHVGTFNEKEDNIRVQLKWTHRDDVAKIDYYQDFHKVLNQDNQWPVPLRKMQRNLSCTFPGISNLTQTENIRTARGSDNGVNIGVPQQVFSYLFYGNKDFYNLPNAF